MQKDFQVLITSPYQKTFTKTLPGVGGSPDY